MIFMICESQVSLMPLSNCKIAREERKKEKDLGYTLKFQS
jgi:hypothetical protein